MWGPGRAGPHQTVRHAVADAQVRVREAEALEEADAALTAALVHAEARARRTRRSHRRQLEAAGIVLAHCECASLAAAAVDESADERHHVAGVQCALRVTLCVRYGLVKGFTRDAEPTELNSRGEGGG